DLLLSILAYTSGAVSGPPSGTQNDWRVVFSVSGFEIWWTIALTSGTHNVTFPGTASNQGFIMAEYSGSGAVGATLIASGALAIAGTSVNWGPGQAVSGIAFVAGYFGQASAYASSSGSTNRTTIDNLHRAWLSDNLGITGAYTETGTITGPMTFGGFDALVTF